MITNSIRNTYPGLGSPGTTYSRQNFPAASGASTVACVFGTAPDAYTTFSGKGPVRQGMVRVKTEAPVASFLVDSIVGKDASGNQYVLYHGDVATALTGVVSAVVDQLYQFQSDTPLTEIDVMITAGAAVNASLEIAAGS